MLASALNQCQEAGIKIGFRKQGDDLLLLIRKSQIASNGNGEMRIVNTHGALYFGTPLQEFARRREYSTGEIVIQVYRYGAWVEICPGNEAAFRPMRIIPSYPNQYEQNKLKIERA